jgi:hypothetical protein
LVSIDIRSLLCDVEEYAFCAVDSRSAEAELLELADRTSELLPVDVDCEDVTCAR